MDEFRLEIQRRDQEILAMAAKMKALEEQHQDYQRHIAVLKESLCAKEEHYSMLQTDVSHHTFRHDTNVGPSSLFLSLSLRMKERVTDNISIALKLYIYLTSIINP